MHGTSLQRVVNVHQVAQLDAAKVEDPTDQTNGNGGPRLDEGAARGDGHQTSEHTVQQRIDVQISLDDTVEDDGGGTARRGTECGADGNLGGNDRCSAGDRQGGTAVETEPTEPQQQSTQTAQHSVVGTENGFTSGLVCVGLSLRSVAATTGPQDPSCGERGSPTTKVNHSTASEVEHSVGAETSGLGPVVESTQPTNSAPHPVDDHWIDETANTARQQNVSLDADALCNCT
mmetsp:Transcript_25/g.64  ORF Transcript_25/g.64 Transcript_25/m.64 type:complete len:232 (+) Transcript_25:594-1289(+)